MIESKPKHVTLSLAMIGAIAEFDPALLTDEKTDEVRLLETIDLLEESFGIEIRLLDNILPSRNAQKK